MKKNYIYRILSALALCIIVAGCGRSGNGKEENLNNNAGIDSIQSESSAQTESMELPKEEAEGETEEEPVKEIELSEIPENMLAYWMVLNNKKPFVSMNEDKQQFYLNEYFWYLNEVEMAYHADYFMVVDMDGDGEDELVFIQESDMMEILDYEDRQVYSYQFRPLKFSTAEVTTDGVFRTEDLSPTGYARITAFEKDGCKIEPVEGYESGSHDRVRYYFYLEETIAGWLE